MPYKPHHARTPSHRYHEHKNHAKRRGIAFELSFEDWWNLWASSGKWSERGNRPHQYVMARLNDAGPYARDNVVIKRGKENGLEQLETGKLKQLKLTKSQVKEILLRGQNETSVAIAKDYGVTPAHVAMLLNGTRGSYLKGD